MSSQPIDNSSNSAYLGAVALASAPFVFLNFALPLHADSLGIDAIGIGGMFAVFTGSMVIVRPLIGMLLDRFGRRRFFIASFVFYVLAMLQFAGSTDLLDFLFGRGLQGVGAALMWVTVRTMIADTASAQARGEGMGRLTAISVRGSMFGAFYGFTLIGFVGMVEAWVWSFLGYAFFSAIALVWSAIAVTETSSVGLRTQPASQNPSLSPSSTSTSVALGVDSKFSLSPMMIRLFVIVFVSGFASGVIEPIYLIYLKHKFQLSAPMLALAFFPAGLVFAILPKYAGRWADRYGRPRLLAAGMLLAGITSALLPIWPSIWLVASFYILFAAGWAVAGPAEQALVADLAEPAHFGRAMGLREGATGAGAALGPLFGGYLYETWTPTTAFLVNGIMLLVAAVLTLFVLRPIGKTGG